MKGLSKSARRYIALLLSFVMMAMTVMTSAAVEATGKWNHRSDGKWEYVINGERVVSDWLLENGEWYWFDEDGFMVEDCWIKDTDGVDRFYARPGGPIVQRHWYEIKGDWYYFGEGGALLKNGWVQWSADGEVTKDSDWYYVDKVDGKMVTDKWVKWKNDEYYLNDKGIMVKNDWIGNSYVGPDGIKAKNAVVSKDGKQVYVNGKGDFDETLNRDVTVVNGIQYKIENGVVQEIVGVATSSNAKLDNYDAAAVEQLENALADSALSSNDKAKANIADMIVQAIVKDSKKPDDERVPGQKAIVSDFESAQAKDKILRDAYESRLTFKPNDESEGMKVEGAGLIVASNYQSTESGKAMDTINLKLKVTSAATASNANKIIDFDLSLYINTEKITKNLETDVYLTITVPDGFEIDKELYNYKLMHEGEEVKDAVFSENGTVEFSVNHFSPFSIVGTPKQVAPATPATPQNPNRRPSSSGSSSSSNSTAPTGKWVLAADGVRWWYQNPDGTWPANGWAQLVWNGRTDWYYFDAEGYMVTGWITWENNRYYLNPVSDGTQGRMFTGWNEIDGKWYYFRPESGGPQGSLFVNGTTPDGYKVDANGVWVQ